MKTSLFLLLLSTSFSALAQSGSYSKAITNDAGQLRIWVDIRNPDQIIQYNRTFDVTGLDRSAVAALERRVLDSLEAVAATPVVLNKAAIQRGGEEVSPSLTASRAVNTSARQIDYRETVEENLAEGRLKIRFTFRADGQDSSVERSATIRDNSEGGRRKLRQEIERQLTTEMENVVSLGGV